MKNNKIIKKFKLKKELLKKRNIVVSVILFAIISFVGITTTMNKVSANSKTALLDNNVFVREVDGQVFEEDDILIMGYKPMDYAQVMSFILTKANKSPYGAEGIDLNGLTLNEHLINANAAAYLEGVDPNVIITQQILETSIYVFKYQQTGKDGKIKEVTSMVKPSDYNYAGLGAVDGGSSGNGFSSNSEGQLAQAQHLKAYASTEAPSTTLVDKRFDLVKRGVSPTLKGLSKAWASNDVYGEHIADLYTEMMNHETDIELVKQYTNKPFGKKVENKQK